MGFLIFNFCDLKDHYFFQTIDEILAEFNVEKQLCDSIGDIAYLCADVSGVDEAAAVKILNKVNQTPSNLASRSLFFPCQSVMIIPNPTVVLRSRVSPT